MKFANVLLLQRQLETLGEQRAGLEDMLKDMKRKVCFLSSRKIFMFGFNDKSIMCSFLCNY